ncbi:MAG: ThiF family adenylyltransferase [Pasteurella sp.]|nr:ThiF family adenylyltransferase [Pasteurella sp.]
MKKMVIKKYNSADNPFDRQNRMSWWSQEKVSQAKVMVVGAGALGNETLKNLALLGVRNFFIVDFDTVSTSNLSRAVLFKKEDKGKKKAEIIAERLKELCLADDVRIDWLHGDIVWDLGSGIYKEMDIVLGCLDNIETRFHVNRQCYLTQTPWIDAGIYELGLRVTSFSPNSAPCYQCSASESQLAQARKRYSCDNFKKKVISEGKVATVQVASAIASAIQTQEAMKIICDQQVQYGKQIYFQGKSNYFDVFTLAENENCTAHQLRYPEIIDSTLTNQHTVEDSLNYLSEEFFDGDKVSIDIYGDRDYVKSLSCRGCGTNIDFYMPAFRIFDTDTFCQACKESKVVNNSALQQQPAEKELISSFHLNLPNNILQQTLHEIGIPMMHIIAVKKLDSEDYKYFQLTGDKVNLIPNISR